MRKTDTPPTIIFLDFDGVITSPPSIGQSSSYRDMFDRDRLNLIREFINQTGAEVVISSDWRMHFDAAEIISLLKPEIDQLHEFWCTPILRAHTLADDIPVPRGAEIATWLLPAS